MKKNHDNNRSDIARRKLHLRKEKIAVLDTKVLHLAGGVADMSCDEISCDRVCSK